MKTNTKTASIIVIIIAAVLCMGYTATIHGKSKDIVIDGPNVKNSIDSQYYFTYNFNKRPSMGMIIIKLWLYDRSGRQTTALDITGDSGMPSMRGAHDTGDVAFRLNKKNEYLLPVNLVMPGEWAIRLKFKHNKKLLYEGIIKIKI